MTAPVELALRALDAPFFRHVRDNVGSVYNAWAEHYNQCTTCRRDDWYEPDLGEALFCHEGQKLFRAWVKITQPKR